MKPLILSICVAMGLVLAPVYVIADESNAVNYVKDSVITTKIKSKIAAEMPKSAARLKVDTDDSGQVWLHGIAKSADEADQAVQIARSTEGVKSVKSEIIVKREPE